MLSVTFLPVSIETSSTECSMNAIPFHTFVFQNVLWEVMVKTVNIIAVKDVSTKCVTVLVVAV